MICRPCARAADERPGGHDPKVCEDHGHLMPGCTCAHGTQAPPAAPHEPQEPQR